MSDLFAQLRALVPEVEQSQVSGWLDGPARPPDAVLDALLVLARTSSPWLPFFLRLASVYLPFEKVPTRKEYFLRACNAVHRCWQEPGPLCELTPQVKKLPKYLVTVANAVDAACAVEGPACPLVPALRLLLPDRYLVTLGWDNLTPYVAPQIMRRLQEQGREGVIKREHWKIARQLFFERNTPDTHAFALAAVAMLSSRRRGRERYSPKFIYDSLNGAAKFLYFIHIRGVSDLLGEINLESKIKTYLETEALSITTSSKGYCVKRYLDCAKNIEEYVAIHPGFLAWTLPLLKRSPQVGGLLREAKAAEQARRGEEVKALATHYLSLIAGVKARMAMFAQIHELYQVAVKQFLEQGHREPVPFTVRLIDNSAVLLFAVFSVNALLDRGLAGEVTSGSRYIAEFRGAFDASGHALPDPFFVEVYWLWHDLAHRKEVEEFQSVEDYKKRTAHMLKPDYVLSKWLAKYIRECRGKGEKPKIYLDLDGLCAGAAYGGFALLTTASSAMRSSDVQQIKSGRTGMGISPQGFIECEVCPKGHRRDKYDPVVHLLSPKLKPYWKRITKIHRLLWGRRIKVEFRDGGINGFEADEYFFQSGGQHISSANMLRLMRFISFGIDLKRDSGESFQIYYHIFRYIYGNYRQSKGDDKKTIQKGFVHSSAEISARYMKHLSQLDVFQDASDRTLWEAMLASGVRYLG